MRLVGNDTLRARAVGPLWRNERDREPYGPHRPPDDSVWKCACEGATHAYSEEATKTALVMPFLEVLGYDVFDPREVVPEYVTDVGLKRGDKESAEAIGAHTEAISARVERLLK